MSRYPVALVLWLSVALLITIGAVPVFAANYSAWSAADDVESIPGTSSELNTSALDGCPIQAPDGLSLYMASTRTGGQGGIDIWVAHRSSTDAGWGAPSNLSVPINSTGDDFCPTPVRGKGLFFVSTRAGGCGAADIYFARKHPVDGWTTPVNLGCDVNSSAGEASPSYVDLDGAPVLYFSSNRSGTSKIYRSTETGPLAFASPNAVVELNSATAEDARPNVRKDGLEIVFDSTRAGGLGGPDIYVASRDSVNAPWSAPVNLGAAINSDAAETRASLSWDGQTLLFGSTRAGGEGSTDIYFSMRTKVAGASD